VFAVGVLPTPGIAHLTRRLEAQGGVVISASHNPYDDNGIKIFSSEGTKFPDAWEDEIEARLAGPDHAPNPTAGDVGRLIPHRHQAEADYAAHASGTFAFDLRGLHVVLDCAHGATYRVGPRVFETLGARVTVMGAEPDGQNINLGVGALHPEGLQAGTRPRGRPQGWPSTATATGSASAWTTGQMRRRLRPGHLRSHLPPSGCRAV
jgi:phosphoglucosamine mutase